VESTPIQSNPAVTQAPLSRVLIIDDSPTARGILRRSLASGFKDLEICEAEDGKSAMREMTKGKVDLIVTDLEMPGVDGHRFLQTIRQNPLLKRKKVLVFSSAIGQALKDSFADHPNVGFLSKPADAAGIAQAVRGLLAAPLS
jgi:CheY-like chemotaxis protein